MLHHWSSAVQQLEKGRDFAVATIISAGGACSPPVGARLLVLDEGTIVGTIKEGRGKTHVRDLTLRVIERRCSHRARVSFCEEEGEEARTDCTGETDVLIEFVEHQDPILERIFRGLNQIMVEKRAAYFISELSILPGEWSPHSIRHALMDTGNLRIGGFPGCLQLIEALHGRGGLKSAQVVELGGWEYPVFLEWIRPAGKFSLYESSANTVLR